MVPFHVSETSDFVRLAQPNIIWDTDWWTDVDDVIAARLLSWAHVQGKINVIAVGLDTTFTNGDGAKSLDGFLKTDGLTTVPIAVPLTSHIPNGSPPYQATMATRTAGIVDPSRVYLDAVTVYRTALAAATDHTVDIISVGYLNNMQELLASPADGISALTGAQLIAAKVRYLWVMGGDYPTGNENNFNRDAQSRTAANVVCATWPTPILFSGFSVGNTVVTGGNLVGQQATDLVAQALVDYGSPSGRSSWDGMNTLLAIAQNPVLAGYAATRGTNTVNSSTGANTFTPSSVGSQFYLSKTTSDAAFVTMINTLLVKSNWGTYDPYPL